MNSASVQTTDTLSFTCLTTSMKDKILELHSNDWYVESIQPTTDLKVRIVAKKLIAGMASQSWSDIDLKDFWFRYAQMRDFKVQENKGSPHSEK